MSRRRAPPAALVAGALGTVLVAAGCGGTGGSRATSPTVGPGTSRSITATHASASAPRRVAGVPIGRTQTVRAGGSTRLSVTVLRVVALPHTGSPILPGTRQLGVMLRIANQAGATYDSTSSGDVSLVLSRGSQTPLDVRRGPCATPLVDFESMIVSGSVRTGCVAFSVPRAARVLAVRFSPHERPPGTVSWRVG